ncbi:MAG: methyltransferase [Candidatus Omnitrophica bacterium]|nr:methyltransferase [Candidatus Omnitrophota bacterium]MCM8769617.1 methyltransferase [Candidatus Omnitrophota bacterium]
MTRRERIIAALEHLTPDRIPIDLGGMDSTGITGIAYRKLKQYLGLIETPVLVWEPSQQLAMVEIPVLERIGACVLPIFPQSLHWKKAFLPDGSICQVPSRWQPYLQPDGSEVILDENGQVTLRRPTNGHYFEVANFPLQGAKTVRDIEKNRHLLERFDLFTLADETYEEMGKRAGRLYQETDFALMGNFSVHLFAAGQLLRGFEQFLIDLATDSPLAHCLLENLVSIYTERFDRFQKAVGCYVQVINVNDDLGMQEGPLLSPSLYRRTIKRYQQSLYQHIRKNSKAKLFLHTDGSVYQILPDLIDIGVQVLNPIQFSCRDMELRKLKKKFGKDLVFWGGGCDTQKILPFATPDEVRQHVTECISVLAPEGGFVFSQVHNIQPDVPPENIMAMYQAVHDWKG